MVGSINANKITVSESLDLSGILNASNISTNQLTVNKITSNSSNIEFEKPINLKETLNVDSNTVINSTLNVEEDSIFKKNLNINDNAYISGELNASSLNIEYNSNLNDLNVSGVAKFDKV